MKRKEFKQQRNFSKRAIKRNIAAISILLLSVLVLSFMSGCSFSGTESFAGNYNNGGTENSASVSTATEGTNDPSAGTPDNKTPGVSDESPDNTGTSTVTPDETTDSTQSKTPGKTSGSNKTQSSSKTPQKTDPTANPSKYALYVNKTQNIVTVYTYDAKGNYTVPVKAMICSTGRDNRTPTGSFGISEKYIWRALYGNVYGQYACRFNGGILFHSVPYKKTDKSTLKSEEYNKLGEQASDGCVRLKVEDAKWIYDNCRIGTKVVVYEGTAQEPLGKPGFVKIPLTLGWDPTDPDENNPCNALSVSIKGVVNKTFDRCSSPDLFEGIYAADSKGNDMTDMIYIEGYYDLNKTGTYNIVYYVTQVNGEVIKNSAVIKITDNTSPQIKGFSGLYTFDINELESATFEKLTEGVTVTDDGEILPNVSLIFTVNGQPYDTALLAEGNNRVDYTAKDNNGNSISGYINIVVTNTNIE